MSELKRMQPDANTAWENHAGLDLAQYLGSTLMIGIAPDGVSYQQVCWVVGREDMERNRRFEIAQWHQGEYVQTVQDTVNGRTMRPYPSLLSYADQRARRELHVASTGDRTRAIVEHLRGNPGKNIPAYPFGTPEALYAPDPADPRHTPRVSGLLDIGAGTKNLYSRKETHVNYNLLTDAKYSQVTEYPLRADAVPGTALTAHAYGHGGAPEPFDGQPYLLPIMETAERTRDFWWEQLPSEYRVSIAVMSVSGMERHYALRNAD